MNERYFYRQLRKLGFEKGEYNIVDAITILKLGELGFSKEEIQQIIEDSRHGADPNAVDPNAADSNAVDPNAADPNAASVAAPDPVMSALEKKIDDLGAQISAITQEMEKSAVREPAQNVEPISQEDAVANALERLSGIETASVHEMYATPQ